MTLGETTIRPAMVLPGNVADLPARILNFLEGGTVHSGHKEEGSVQVSDVEAMSHVVGEVRQGRRVPLMVSIGDGTSMCNGARGCASRAFSDRHAKAIIIRDLGHQMAANVLLRHHRPARPIRLFDDKEAALDGPLTPQHLATA